MVGAIVLLVDTYLVHDDVFESPLEPAIISGLMQSMFWLALPFVDFTLPAEVWIAVLAVVGGILHGWSMYFYFKTIFSFGDISLASILWNLTLAIVPVLAFVFLGEMLSASQYIGIALLFMGALLISYSGDINTRVFLRVLSLMSLSVVFMSVSMVCMKSVYTHTDFWNGYVLYNFGIVGGSLAMLALSFVRKTDRHLRGVLRRYFKLFLFIEFLQLVGEFFYNVAESLGSVSLVSAVESLQDVFVMAFGALIFFGMKFFFKRKQRIVSAMYTLQSRALFAKLFAVAVMVYGAYLVS